MAKDDDADWLFGGEKNDNGEWEAHRRFISEEFNAIYLQGVVGPYHLREAAFSAFLHAARTDTATAARLFLSWVRTDRPQGGDYGDIAMERIAARASGFDAPTALGIIAAFAEVMDEYYALRPKREMLSDIWEQSEGILRTFRTSVPEFDLGRIASQLASEKPALSWLTGTIGRSELWGQGIAGDRKRDPALHQLSERQLRDFLSALVQRISNLKTAAMLALPRLGGVLFTLKESPWHADATLAVLRRLAGPRVSDVQFLTFLEAMAGVVFSSNRGVYYTVSVQSLHALLGEAEFDRRWARLLGKSLPPELAERRQNIANMIADARRY